MNGWWVIVKINRSREFCWSTDNKINKSKDLVTGKTMGHAKIVCGNDWWPTPNLIPDKGTVSVRNSNPYLFIHEVFWHLTLAGLCFALSGRHKGLWNPSWIAGKGKKKDRLVYIETINLVLDTYHVNLHLFFFTFKTFPFYITANSPSLVPTVLK
jgi:hypothetical protein